MFRIDVASRSWVFVLGFYGSGLVYHGCLRSKTVFWGVSSVGLFVSVLGRRRGSLFFGDVAIEGNSLSLTVGTSLLNPMTAPFFLERLWSQPDLRLYLFEEGETVRHLVKSDLLPYPMPVAEALRW